MHAGGFAPTEVPYICTMDGAVDAESTVLTKIVGMIVGRSSGLRAPGLRRSFGVGAFRFCVESGELPQPVVFSYWNA